MVYAKTVRVFGWLLWVDVRRIFNNFWDNLFDSLAWPTALITMSGYVMPAMGVPDNYGAFISVSMLIIMGSYTAWTGSAEIAADLEGPQAITYELTLPLPFWLVWIKTGLYLALKAAVFNISSLILGKLILGDSFNLVNLSVPRFLIVYAVAALFFGFFAAWTTVITKSIEGHSRLDLRLIGPMFYLNGWTASWATMYSVSKALGIFTLCTPWIYAYEGARSAILGSEGYLPFWHCVGMLLFFATIFLFMGMRLFKKRMDCV